ncbi:MAG TPA: glutamine cyclotransferase [Rhodanobacteraceae bacterium]|jgi:glutamine cyclotransferase|nr:glutamine cyclotransferase [Rhodanobacteraceae bacterium]
MKRSQAEILHELGPFDGAEHVHGVTYDGHDLWFASGAKVRAVDPVTGQQRRALDVAATAGTAFDGRHLYQIGGDRIRKIDPVTGAVLSAIPVPNPGDNSGLTWAEGCLWIGEYRGRRIHQLDPETGDVLRTIESQRFVTGVTWLDGELWHATWEDDRSDLRRVGPVTGELLEQVELPLDTRVSGLESNGADRFYCGGGNSGKVRVVRRPRT